MLIDTGGLDKVVEINVRDAYVVVEAGVTWEALQQALQAKGVRTPYFGPMSGSHATVGGALSQGSVFHGSARYGSSADSVLGLEVVTANGEILRTGSAARKAVAAFGTEVENSVPKVMAANPFAARNAMLGSAGERWAPIHGIVPHSRSTELFNVLQDLFASEKAVMDEHGLFIGTLMTTVGAQATLIEPCIYWPDSHNAFHVRTVDPDHRARIGCPGENLPARAATDALKRKIADTMRVHGAASFQIGKFYTYREGRDPAALAMLDAIKQQLDPKGLMNPGVLGR